MKTYKDDSYFYEKYLTKIAQNEPYGSLRYYVAMEALDYSYNVTDLFRNLERCGCQGGLVGGLIYYRDTHSFFDTYYDEIEELREDWEDSVGQHLQIKGDLKNWLAWFAFEETAHRLHTEIETEIEQHREHANG